LRDSTLGTVEHVKKIRHGRYVLIPYSDQTHGHFTHYYAAVWKPYLISFMGSLGPTAAAR
jgi:homoserine O-acetyltransferase/O-succinyltransferase